MFNYCLNLRIYGLYIFIIRDTAALNIFVYKSGQFVDKIIYTDSLDSLRTEVVG